MAATMTCGACGSIQNSDTPDAEDLIQRSDIRIENRRMTPEALWAMGRIGSVAPSPDGKQIAYAVTYYSVPQNKSNSELFVMNADGSANTQITRSALRENQPAWIKGGQKLAYLSTESGSSQIWEMNPDGSGKQQLTNYDGDIEGFSFSPDGKKLLFIAQVKTVQSTKDKYPDLDKTTGIIVTDLMYKHWDEWVTTAPHPFVADFDGSAISNVTDILQGEPYESPMKPFGGIEQLAWSPDSKEVAYTCRKKTGLEYAISTNSDIYIYDLASKQTRNITEENKGYDTNPQYSPDGKYIAWQSMERDGYEADWNRLFVMDRQTGEKRFLSKGFPSNVDAFLWNSDSQSIFFTGVWHGMTPIYNVSLKPDGWIYQLTNGLYDYGNVSTAEDLAKIAAACYANETYMQAANTLTYTLPATNLHQNERTIKSTNLMLDPEYAYHRDYVRGMKTGFTTLAGRCFVTFAQQDGHTYGLVVLGSDMNNIYRECAEILDWAFSSFSDRQLVDTETVLTTIPLTKCRTEEAVELYAAGGLSGYGHADDEVTFEFSVPESTSATVKEGAVLGTATVYLDGYEMGTVDLVTHKEYVSDFRTDTKTTLLLMAALIGILIVLGFLTMVAGGGSLNLRRRSRSRRR